MASLKTLTSRPALEATLQRLEAAAAYFCQPIPVGNTEIVLSKRFIGSFSVYWCSREILKDGCRVAHAGESRFDVFTIR